MNNAPNTAIPTLSDIARGAVVYYRRWAIPAAVIAVLGFAYAALRSDTWEAGQALILRGDAVTREASPGKFREIGEMKTAQETVLEVARSRGALEEALSAVGAEPSGKTIVELREKIKISPPKGAEFGKTEVFYLQVRDKSQQRALALVGSLTQAIQNRLKQIRDVKAQSMIKELENAVQLAKADLNESTARLSAVETKVGADLGELRSMGDVNPGDSPLRRTLTEIRAELRVVEAAAQGCRQQIEIFTAAKKNPDRLVSGSSVLAGQSALTRLKEGLVEARLHSAKLLGKMSETHPLVIESRQAETEVEHRLHDELTSAITGAETELSLNETRKKTLESELAEYGKRLDGLAALRASYANLSAEQNHRLELVKRAEENLAEARAAEAGAKAASQISLIDTADAGIRPIGPSRAVIALGGILCGILAGLGVLLLTVSPKAKSDWMAAAVDAADDADIVVAREPKERLSFREALERVGMGGRA